MKKVLFYYDNYCGQTSKGGTEVATYRIAKALGETGKVKIYHAFKRGRIEPGDLYDNTIKLPSTKHGFIKDLSEFIKNNGIDVVVNMSRFFRHKLIVEGVEKSGRDVKVIFMQHFAPGSEVKKSSFISGLHLLKLNPYNPLYWLRASFYPLIRLPRVIRYKKAYHDTYDLSDKVVLLSDEYIKDYQREGGGFRDNSKFVTIPNIYENISSETDETTILEQKKKRVLILSRMDEIQKRLSLALAIWQKIESDPDLSDWNLDIVGTGHNLDIVRRLVKKLELNNVTIHGWQDRETFLRDSSILMMTSEYEGLPLSILEAQAYGCVPVAFNSFGSLKDVVTPYENGVVVEKFGDVNDYVTKLTELMYDEEYRRELGKNGMRRNDKFSSKEISKEWLRILT